MIDFAPKDPTEVVDYLFDWSGSLQDGEGIASQVTTVTGVTLDDSDVVDVGDLTAAGVRVWLSGGAEGSIARVTCTVTTDSSPARTFVETAILPIGGGPVSLARAKAHLRVDFDTEDDLIRAYLRGAVAAVEQRTGRILSPRVIDQRFSGFVSRDGGRRLKLLHDPVSAVVSVTYVDEDGASQTLDEAEYRSIEGEPWSVIEAVGASWPATDVDRGDAVKVRYAAGYEAGDCPADLQSAVLLMLGHLYMNREAVGQAGIISEMPLGVDMLCAPWRRVSLG